MGSTAATVAGLFPTAPLSPALRRDGITFCECPVDVGHQGHDLASINARQPTPSAVGARPGHGPQELKPWPPTARLPTR